VPVTTSTIAATGASDAVADATSLDQPVSQDFISRAQAGDPAALGLVEATFEANPTSWDVIIRLAGAEERLVVAIAGEDALKAAALRRRADVLRADLAGSAASPLERLVAERIVLTWLGVIEAERLALGGTDRSIRQAEYFDRRLDRAQRRHLAAIKALAVVRRLGVPVIQLNVAERQVNVGQIDRDRD
jgi:hypothetical protein